MRLDNVFCIHRNIDKERFDCVQEELKKTSLEVSFVEPDKKRESDIYNDSFNSAMDSLRMTTIRIVETAKEKNLPYLVIMEDDCVFVKSNWEIFINTDLPKEYYFIHLNVTANQSYGFCLENKIYRHLRFGECCQFYIINQSVYDIYLTLLKDNFVPIDKVTSYIHYKYGKSFAVEPFPVLHEQNRYSTLKDKVVKY